ncbi:MAG TPA: cobalamin-binding protein [Gemmatimonadales bacterium]|nr:cobalamin-binding protein [Gemmatimonadales bacterium]
MSGAARIVSLLPGATEIVCALGLSDRLVGISHSCDAPAAVRDRPRLTRPRFSPAGRSSGAIDAAVRHALRAFGGVYEVDAGRLAALRPDLVFTQGVCQVCAVPVRDAERAAAALPGVAVVSLDAHDLEAVLDTVRTVARAAGVPRRGDTLARTLRRRLDRVRAELHGVSRPRVLALEWLDPPFVPGHWVPEMITLAGGDVLRGRAAHPSFAVSWDELEVLDPDVLLVMPCGFDLARARAEARRYGSRLARVAPRAIRAGRAYALDASALTSRPGPRVVEGVELLAALFHPDRRSARRHDHRAYILGNSDLDGGDGAG